MQGTQEYKLKSLVEAIKREDHNEIYEFSKELLKDSPDDPEYQQCFIISSLKISLGDELGQSLFKNPPTQDALHELYAYYLYDRGEFDKVIQYVQSVKDSPKLSLILAQAYFRAQNYQKSAELMTGLIRKGNMDADLKDEYRINFLATGVNKFVAGELQDYEKLMINPERKELLYNYALIMLEQGKFKQTNAYLHEFESSLVEGRDENDIAMVKLLKDYIEWKSNKTFDRSVIDTYERYQEKITDKNVLGVIQNNLLFYRQGQVTENTHQILRMFDEILESEYKMTKRQRGLIHLNKLSVLLRKGRFPEAQKLIKEIETRDELLRDPEYIKNKYFLMKKNKDEHLPSFIEQVAKWNSSLAFCLRADFEKQRGNETDLIADLKAPKGKEVTNPIIKNYIFSLLIKHSSLFEQYSDYLAEMAGLTKDSSILFILLNVYENKADREKQRFILLRLLEVQPKNSNVKVKLAKLYLEEGKIEEAEEVLRGVEGPEELGDIAYLQFIEKNIHVSIQKEEDKNEIIKKQEIATKKRIKKKKRVRLPKNIEKVIEGFKGDPERWLPKWQRKGYKKKGKKGAGKTQGLATISKQQTKNVFTTGASTSGKEVTKQAVKKRK